MFVDRDGNGKLIGLYMCAQVPGQEELADDRPEIAACRQALVNPPIVRVTPLQIRMALRRLGLLDQVNAFVATQSPDMQDAWQYADFIPINNLMVLAVADAVKADLTALFKLAATLP